MSQRQNTSIMLKYTDMIMSKLPQPPFAVISTGVCGFMVLTYIFSIFNSQLTINWSLSPNSLIQDFDTIRLNTFPLVHISFLHLFFNLIVLYYPLSEFEITHGSLHTAIILNTLGAVTGIAYTITSYILVKLKLSDESILNTFILGSSGWAFTFLTVNSCYKSINHPATRLFNSFNIPTILVPLFYLVFSMILLPNSSFLGHLISVILGILIFKNIFSLITIPPFQILDKIESLEIFKYSIKSIFPPEYFIWTWENEVKSSRYLESEFHGIGLPLHHGNLPNTSNTEATTAPVPQFEGQGDKLGTNL